MNSYKKLINNSFIFAVGTLGSRIISFLLVPLYTYVLSTSEYGTVDLVINLVYMLVPIVTFAMYESVLRFSASREKKQENILTNSISLVFIGFLLSILFYPFLQLFNIVSNYAMYLYLIVFLQGIERVLGQYVRGSGNTKLFAVNGVLITFTTGISNIFFLVFLELGVVGYFYALIVSYFISTIFLLITSKAYKHISLRSLNISIMGSLLKYSLPMIPNTLMWWLINASSRFFIVSFAGIEANGLFAVASKLPSIMNVVSQVFTQAWQLTAIDDFQENNKGKLYTSVFRYYSELLIITGSIIVLFLKPIFSILYSSNFYNGWMASPFLIIGSIFSAFSGFLGAAYIASTETKGVLKTSIYGGMFSILLNILLIPNFGIIGAGLSSMLCFLSMFILRYFDTKKYIDFNFNVKKLLISVGLLLVQILILFIDFPSTIELSSNLLILLLIILFNNNIISLLFKVLKSLSKRILN